MELAQENILLLDKLYNLKSEDSIITNNIKENIERLEKSKEELSTQKEEEENRKNNLEKELADFNNQTSIFFDTFSSFDDDSFSALRAINVNLDLGSLREKVETEMPVRQEELSSKIKESEGRLVEKTNNISDLKDELKVENDNLVEAEKTRNRLNNLLDDILINKNDSYTRGYIKGVLSELNVFSEEDISTLEFLILFPEKGLIEYEEKYKDRDISEELTNNDIIENDKPLIDMDKQEEEEPVIDLGLSDSIESDENLEKVNAIEEPPLPVDEPITNNIFSVDDFVSDDNDGNILESSDENEDNNNLNDLSSTDDILKNENDESNALDNNEELTNIDDFQLNNIFSSDSEDISNAEASNFTIVELLKSLNINYEDVDVDTLALLENVDADVIKRNVELLRGIDAEDLLLFNSDGYMYITDLDLVQKINLIRSKGINDNVIKTELRNGNFRESYSSLEKKVDALKNNSIDLNEENISMLKDDIVRYYENLSVLRTNGIELDDKEIRNFKELLQTSSYVTEDLEILKQNMIKIVRRNGKYALDIFWLEPQELTDAINKLNANDLGKLIEISPDILTKNIDVILKVVKYCSDNNIPILDNETNSYYKYVYDYEEFVNMFKDANLEGIS